MPAVAPKSIDILVMEGSLTPKHDEGGDSRFSKLNQKAEEMKKVNLFYLKDILIKQTSSYEEKLDCLWKIKRNVQKPVFGMAMKALLPEFSRIGDPLIQRELLSAMACSHHSSLIPALRELLRGERGFDEFTLEEIEDTISALSLVAKQP